MNVLPRLLLALSLWTTSLAVAAQSQAVIQLFDVLLENGTITQAQYDTLIQALEADQHRASSTPNTPTLLHIETEGGLEVATYDGAFSVELGGRLQLDAAHYDEDKTALGDGTELRRARIELEGTLFEHWQYEFGVDFGGADVDIEDAYISYVRQWPTLYKFGQFKEPFGLEKLTSSRHITFMERSLANELTPGRAIGAGIETFGDGWSAAAGLFGEAAGDDVVDEGDEGYGLTGRVTAAPYSRDMRLLHLGASGSWRSINDEQKVRFRSRPESHITDVRFLNTGKIKDAEDLTRWGLEAATVLGPFSAQAEYIHAGLNRNGKSNLNFHGWYVATSWFLTGESRPYKHKRGVFGRVKPNSNHGALELALRFSRLDLTDQDVFGGAAHNTSIGLNWYANERARVMANYIFSNNDEFADNDGNATGGDNVNIFQTRVQIDFE